MASNYSSVIQNMKEEITCPVCLDILTDPQALSCLHVLCLQCANGIARTAHNQSVLCPTCRKTTALRELQKDFRSVRSIEQYHNMASLPAKPEQEEKPSSSKPCQLCDEKPAVYMCQNCNKLMCHTCRNAHLKITTCQDKDSVTLASMTQTNRDELKEWRNKLEDQATAEQTSYSKDMKEMEDQQQTALDSIDKQEEDALQHFRNERQNVLSSSEYLLTLRATEHYTYQNQIRERINYINAMEQEDQQTVQELFEFIVDELKKELDQLQSTSFSLTQMAITNKEFDREKAIRVSFTSCQKSRNQVTDPSPRDQPSEQPHRSQLTDPSLRNQHSEQPHSNQPTDPSPRNQPSDQPPSNQPTDTQPIVQPPISFTSLASKLASIKHSLPLPGTAYKTLLFNNELFCVMWDSIRVYNPSNGQHTRTSPTGLKSAWSLAITNTGRAIVATEEDGLVEYDLQGDRLQCLSGDPHWDVATPSAGDGAVALRRRDGVLHIDQYDGQLQRVRQTATAVNASFRVTCALASGCVFICSEGQNTVYRVDPDSGQTLQTYGCYGDATPGHLKCPYLCCTDGKALLIADCGNDRLQILDSRTNEWKVLGVNGFNTPTAAVVDREGRLYVAGGALGSYTLYVID